MSPEDFDDWILAFNEEFPASDYSGDHVCTPADLNSAVLNFNNVG